MSDNTEITRLLPLNSHRQGVVFHEAGHAVSIYLNNQAKKLPPVFFEILLKDLNDTSEEDLICYQASHDDCMARAEGGRLIKSLPFAIEGLVHVSNHPPDGKDVGRASKMDEIAEPLPLIDGYMAAFDADVINLLVGPLAEAKYITDADDELFSLKLINLGALKNYGGSSDLVLVNEYLQSFSTSQQQRDDKSAELFALAFSFIMDTSNWAAITLLANYILDSHKNIISYEEIALLFDH
ncbi:MAG: hypothetical protein U1D70_16755 [Methylobacter sp.]|nr:hypothetical protein [Methylobacter sp.]MDP2428219.1 hypothetical protein [Methylobacter sp.]MDP3055197.1 hypothetical protein [Methylobacter sp.]MDP3364273.1 hypothetical protein [Methylobacter sp.]MDZ4220655.1 hypothetical protein [Methylobacter sp.]